MYINVHGDLKLQPSWFLFSSQHPANSWTGFYAHHLIVQYHLLKTSEQKPAVRTTWEQTRSLARRPVHLLAFHSSVKTASSGWTKADAFLLASTGESIEINRPTMYLKQRNLLVRVSKPVMCTCRSSNYIKAKLAFLTLKRWLASMATYSSTLAWKIPWTEEPGRL